MKNNLLIYNLLLLAVFVCSSCLEEDEKYAKKTEAPGTILFVVPDEATIVPPVNQPRIVQPSLDVVSGRFKKAENLIMTIQLPSGLTDLTINVLTTAGARQTKATFTNISGSVDFTAPMNKLNINDTAITTSAVLEFIATGSAGSITRVFTVTAI
jgi:hypothetical protein